MNEPMLMSIIDAAKILGLGRSTIYKKIDDGTLKTVCIGSRRLVRVASVRELAGEESAE